MVQFLSITFLLLNFFNFCWVFQKFPFFCVTRSLKTDQDDLSTCTYNKAIYIYIYRVSQEERTKLREGVPYVKLYRYNPKHLYPKLNGYGDSGKRSLKL